LIFSISIPSMQTKEGLKYQLGKDYNKIVVSTLKEAEFFATEVKDVKKDFFIFIFFSSHF